MKLNPGTSLTAAALLLGAGWLGMRPEEQPPSSSESPHQTHASTRSASASRTGNEPVEREHSRNKRGHSLKARSNKPGRDEDPVVNSERNPIGVRLGNQVRLPATAIAKGSAAFATPEIAAANQELETRFYQNILHRKLEDLGKSASRKKAGNHEEEIPLDENGERTVTVEPGPETEQVLQDSDEAFRSLFGNEAYNRRKLEGLMEVRD